MKQLDVFICYASADRALVDAMAVACESRGIRCWYAARDIPVGASYPARIMEAIRNARVMVVVLSESANASNHVKNELERALHHGLHIIPFRIEETEPAPDLEYLVARKHWLDALPPPAQDHIARLADTIAGILNRSKPDHEGIRGAVVDALDHRPNFRRRVPAIAALIAVLLLGGSWFAWREFENPRHMRGTGEVAPSTENGETQTVGGATTLASSGSENAVRETPRFAKGGGAEDGKDSTKGSRRESTPESHAVVQPVIEPASQKGKNRRDKAVGGGSNVSRTVLASPEETRSSSGKERPAAAMNPSATTGTQMDTAGLRLGFGGPASAVWTYVVPCDCRVRFEVLNLMPAGTESATISGISVNGQGFYGCGPERKSETSWRAARMGDRLNVRVAAADGHSARCRILAEFEELRTSSDEAGSQGGELEEKATGLLGFDGSTSDEWSYRARSDGRVRFTIRNLMPEQTGFATIKGVSVNDVGFYGCGPAQPSQTSWRAVRKGERLQVTIDSRGGHNVQYEIRAEVLPN